MKHALIAIILFTAVLTATAQIKYDSYIILDTTYYSGYVKPIGSKQLYFQKTKNDTLVIYNANQVKQFRVNDKIFDAFPVNGEMVFYERIITGDITIYRRKKTYLLKKGETVTKFDRSDFRQVMITNFPCGGGDQTLSRLAFSRPAITNYIESSKDGSCDSDHLPYGKFGLFVGLNFYNFKFDVNLPRPVVGVNLSYLTFVFSENQKPISIGFFADFPLNKSGSVYLSTELHASSATYNYSNPSTPVSRSMAIDVKTLIAPISFKVLLLTGDLKPYLKAGGLVSYLNIQSSGLKTTTEITPSITASSFYLPYSSSGLVFGFDAGAGVEFSISQRKSAHLEAKYVTSTTGDLNPVKTSFSGISILAGFSL